MKLFLASLLLIISSSAFALSPKEAWNNANKKDKVKILNEYRDFYKQLDAQDSSTLSEFQTTSYYKFFINDAYAASTDGMNCVYAGWPSKRVNNLCSSPQRQNPNYTSGSCGASQMQCQPMLFGKDICVPVATKSERSLAFSNCSKKFEASKKTTEDIVNQIKENKQAAELFEFMDFAKEICASGKQASTPMCRRLEGTLDSLKSAADRLKESLTEVPQKKDESDPEIILDGEKIQTPSPADLKIVEAVTSVTAVNIRVSHLPKVDEVCEEPIPLKLTIEGIPYERDAPRFSDTEYIGSQTDKNKFWDNRYIKFKESPKEIPSGFGFKNVGPNDIASAKPIDPEEKVQRDWSFTTADGSRQESYLWVTDDSGSGKLSELMESIILLVPRKVQPSIELSGDDMVVTLSTGEKVIYDKMTRTIKSGAFKEGKVESRKFAPITYSGSGISIRVDKRGEDPRLFGGSATIIQNGAKCTIPVGELWTKGSKFKYGDDAKLLGFLNTKCGNKFKL